MPCLIGLNYYCYFYYYFFFSKVKYQKRQFIVSVHNRFYVYVGFSDAQTNVPYDICHRLSHMLQDTHNCVIIWHVEWGGG